MGSWNGQRSAVRILMTNGSEGEAETKGGA